MDLARKPRRCWRGAVSLHLEGKRKEALKDLGDAIDSGLQDAELYSARGHVQFELEMFDEAARSYTRLLELAPDHLSGIFNLAVCYEKLGRWEEGAQLFERSVRAQPTRVEARLGLAICQLQAGPGPRSRCTTASRC